jgi:hypothetical protein
LWRTLVLISVTFSSDITCCTTTEDQDASLCGAHSQIRALLRARARAYLDTTLEPFKGVFVSETIVGGPDITGPRALDPKPTLLLLLCV